MNVDFEKRRLLVGCSFGDPTAPGRKSNIGVQITAEATP